MNCSIFFSMHMLWMKKMIRYCLRYFKIGERIFPWLNISPSPSPIRDYSWWRAGKFSSWWFCFCLWLACKSLASNINSNSSNWTSEVSCSLLFKLTHLWEPWEILTQEWELSLFMGMILISTPCLPCKNWLQLLIRAQFWCSLGSILLVVILLHLLVECTHDGRCMKSWEFRSVFRHKYCPISTTLRNPASIQNLLNLSCFDSFSIRSSYCWNWKFWYAGSSLSKGTSVLIALSTIDCPITTSRPVLSWRDSYSSHISATAP